MYLSTAMVEPNIDYTSIELDEHSRNYIKIISGLGIRQSSSLYLI